MTKLPRLLRPSLPHFKLRLFNELRSEPSARHWAPKEPRPADMLTTRESGMPPSSPPWGRHQWASGLGRGPLPRVGRQGWSTDEPGSAGCSQQSPHQGEVPGKCCPLRPPLARRPFMLSPPISAPVLSSQVLLRRTSGFLSRWLSGVSDTSMSTFLSPVESCCCQ